MAFKFITVLFATLAFTNAGLIQQAIPAYSSAPAVSSVYSSISAPSVLSTRTLVAAPAALNTISTIPSYQTIGNIQPITRIAYSPASEVSHVYSSIGAPAALSISPAAQLSYAPAQQIISSPAYGSSQQSTIRSLAGTVSHYSKAVDTAFSSVRKADTRISNNVYAPALATKTIAYAAAPALATKTIAYAAAPAISQATLIQQNPIVSHVSFDGIGARYAW